MVEEICAAHLSTGDVKELGGDLCTLEALLLAQVNQAAALHTRYWNDKEVLNRYKNCIMHADWLVGEGKASFESAGKQVIEWGLMKFATADNCLIKEFPEALKVIQASTAKHSWEAYKATYSNPD